jgi:asparagine synthase (glutamine-hydrolysing)
VCGLAGVLDPTATSDSDALHEVVAAMSETLRHRGPDDAGVWTDAEAGIGLGLRRLAVVDLSAEGHQPMASVSGRYIVAFNGEIYNHRQLRNELEGVGHRFRGHSDTEVLLAAVVQWGLRRAIERFNGMFAFALWDREARRLHLARDRLGEKPLYFGRLGGAFVFASELKALRAHPAFSAEIDRDALALLLRHKYVPSPRSIYRGISKLPSATVLTVDPRMIGDPVPVPYWSLAEVAERGMATPFRGSPDEATDALDELLGDAVALRMIADVPLGAFLSGGIDSSTVVALMQAQSDRPVRTFTIGFQDSAYDESGDAGRVARHLGTDHTDLSVTPEEAMELIPRLPYVYDEPFADSSQIPTFLVAELARRHVTVSLSGDGGDEVFGGYNRYAWGPAMWRRFGWMPGGLRRIMAGGLGAVSPRGWDALAAGARPFLPRRARQRLPGEKIHKLARALRAAGPDGMYRALVSHWQDPQTVVLGAGRGDGASDLDGATLPDLARRMMYADTVTYLPDDILVKLDRATMAVSLEGRVPYLDHRVVEFAWRLPPSMRVRDGEGKWLLRRVLHRYVPRELVERPKMGFGLPIGSWLRGPLRGWAESLLDPARLRREGYLDPVPIRTAWTAHLSGRRNRQYELWDVLMFQAWLEASSRSPRQVVPA